MSSLVRRTSFCAGIGLIVLLSAVSARAHTSLPAYLELNEVAAGTFTVVWRVPAAEGPPPAIYPVLPAHCSAPDVPAAVQALGSVITSGVVACGSAGLVDHLIAIDGLRVQIMDVLVRIAFLDGTRLTRVLKPDAPSFVVQMVQGSGTDGWGYVRLGIDHILSGIDHLLFVFGLLLLVAGVRRLVKAVTAFTAAHSITLGLATVGLVHVPPAPVEALIALSIVFLAVELVQYERGQMRLTHRKPWLVTFAFGLLHGFGFAGALSQIGLPSDDIPMALLSFNLGVEAGQLAFIAVALVVFAALRRVELRPQPWMRLVPAYIIGTLASLWFVERCALLIG